MSAFCASLVLFPDVPLWAFVSALIFWSWRFLLERYDLTIPSRFLTGFISIIFFLATFYSFRSFIGKEASTCFLLILSSLKFLEYREESEKNFLTLLGFFLVCAKFLFSLDLIYTLIEAPVFLIMVLSLLPADFEVKPARHRFRIIASFILAALPLTFFLYFFFPRFTQTWTEYRILQGRTGISGMSDEVYPGSVEKLVESNEIAFRAEFQHVQPQISDLYWRGEVFTWPQGLRWKKDPRIKLERFPTTDLNNENWDIKVTQEPHFRNWLFVLEGIYALKSEQNPFLKKETHVFSTPLPLEKRSVFWGLWKKPDGLPLVEGLYKTRKPQFSDAISTLAQQISGSSPSPESFAQELLHFFSQKNFRYTLTPGDQRELSLDDFIFKTKKGFCEHYASASALIFLAAGYQARVVAGYHGGTFNNFGNFWTIQQKDAHAWTEYLDSQQRWQRFDATSVIAPLRLQLGASEFSSLNETEKILADISNLQRGSNRESWISRLDLWFENLNYKWNTILLDYDLEKQKEILQNLGINFGVLALLSLILVLIFSLSLPLLLKRPRRQSHEIIFSKINSFFSRFELAKKMNEGPSDWCLRINHKFPARQAQIKELFDCYIQEAYGTHPGPENLKKTEQLLQQLHRLSVKS